MEIQKSKKKYQFSCLRNKIKRDDIFNIDYPNVYN